jgi:hypothetical protein
VPTDDKKTQLKNAEAAAQWLDAEPKLRDVLKREYDEQLKGRPRNLALERRGEEIEEEILRTLRNRSSLQLTYNRRG